MISLLPYTNRRQIRSARANVTLIKCLIFLIFAMIFLASYSYIAYSFADSNKKGEELITKSDQQSNVNANSILDQAEKIKLNIFVAKTMLNKHIPYSDIITSLASILPDGVVIDSLAINDDPRSTPIDITFKAKSSQKNEELKNNINQSKIFTKYTVKSIDEDKNDTSDLQVTISAKITIKTDNQR